MGTPSGGAHLLFRTPRGLNSGTVAAALSEYPEAYDARTLLRTSLLTVLQLG